MDIKYRKLTIIVICLSVFIILSMQLYKLQIVEQSQYGKESQKNSVRKIVVRPPRGLIYDKNGKVLVDNVPSYTIAIVPKKFDFSKLYDLCKLIKEDTSSVIETLQSSKDNNKLNPVVIKRNVGFEVISYLEENKDKFSGVDYQIESRRTYPAGYRGSHIFGYVGEIPQEQLEKDSTWYYRQGDLVGITGLEKYYENYLRGENGVQLVTVDVNGRVLGSYNEGKNDIKPVSGSDLFITINTELQKYAENLLGGRRGAIVAVDPRNGEVLCLVSKPDFDLSVFSGDKKDKDFSAIFNHPEHPMFNRVIQTRYAPGSTWKMLMALAAMASGQITPNSTISCGGSFTYGGRTFGDHGAYGSINVVVALEYSVNVFFYKLGLMVGLDNLYKYGTMFNFGKKTGIDLPNETNGILPSEEYFNKVYGEGNWSKGLLVNLGIGQGEIGVSPIQMVAYTAAICMDGLYSVPHIVWKISNQTTGKEEFVEVKQRQIDIPKSYFNTVKRGMYLVVNGNGTAKKIRSSKYVLAGKTGTAQNTKGNNHSWFVGFAPYDNPQIAVCVLGENQGWGSEFAAPLAAAIMIRYLSNNTEDVYSELKSKPDIRD